ncbi:MAG: MBL fold metallo-hydrolase [Fimbriimonadaceae bacterium]
MTHVVFLGTGTPNPDPSRKGPAIAIVANGVPLLVDCGPGIVRQAAAAGFTMQALTRVFITHLHSDHTLGYPDLIFTPAVTGREVPLSVWGPPGTQAMTDAIMSAWSEDLAVRLNGGEPSIAVAYEVRVKQVVEGDVIELDGLQIIPFAVTHGAWTNALGYRFDSADRSIVVSGDTTYNENLIRHARGCDVLIHEVCSAKGLAARGPEWQRYHSLAHTTGIELGLLAAIVRPKLLLVHHMLPFGQPETQIVEEIREGFDGEVVIAEDLGVY